MTETPEVMKNFGVMANYEFDYATFDEAVAYARKSCLRNGYDSRFIGQRIAEVKVDVPALLPTHVTPIVS